MIDDTPYDLENGFEVLEITDDKPYEESFKNILVDISDDEEFYDYLDGKNPEEKKKQPHIISITESKNIYSNPYDDYGFNEEYNSYNHYDENKGEKSKMFNFDTFRNNENTTETAHAVNNTQVTPQTGYLPVQAAQNNPAAFPTMMLNFSTKITINATPTTTAQDIKTALNAATPKINSSNSLKCAVGMAAELDRRNINMNIEANIFPDITINVVEPDNSNNGFSNGDVIDVEPKEVW